MKLKLTMILMVLAGTSALVASTPAQQSATPDVHTFFRPDANPAVPQLPAVPPMPPGELPVGDIESITFLNCPRSRLCRRVSR